MELEHKAEIGNSALLFYQKSILREVLEVGKNLS